MNSGLTNIGGTFITVVVIACIIVLFAMIVDLVNGLHKAKIRREKKRSWALKRTVTKFILYEGAMLIAAGVDMLIQLSNLLKLFSVDTMCGIPVVTCVVGIFLCIVEGLSVKEKADEKTQREMSKVAVMASELMTKDDLAEAIAAALKRKE